MTRFFRLFLTLAFVFSSFNVPPVFAGEIVVAPMPVPGTLVELTPAYIPAHLQGLTIHPDNALQFDFLIHKGQGDLDDAQKKQEYMKLVKYFLASLTIADKDQWVNLSPYEKGRIIDGGFGNTEMGRDLLEQDYFLKQITSSLMYPESGLGKEFWEKVYARAYEEYGNTNIPVNTFNKVWITPDEAVVYENGNTAYVLKARLKVMLEEDYLSLENNALNSRLGMDQAPAQQVAKVNNVTSKIVKQIILPELEREINEGKNFALLRQIYSGMVLATWYKKALKASLLGQVYADKAKVAGIDHDPKANDAIYERYLAAFKKGVYNYIKEDFDQYSQQTIPRKYFAGGFVREARTRILTPQSMIPPEDLAEFDNAMATVESGSFDRVGINVLASGTTDSAQLPSAREVWKRNALKPEEDVDIPETPREFRPELIFDENGNIVGRSESPGSSTPSEVLAGELRNLVLERKSLDFYFRAYRQLMTRYSGIIEDVARESDQGFELNFGRPFAGPGKIVTIDELNADSQKYKGSRIQIRVAVFGQTNYPVTSVINGQFRSFDRERGIQVSGFDMQGFPLVDKNGFSEPNSSFYVPSHEVERLTVYPPRSDKAMFSIARVLLTRMADWLLDPKQYVQTQTRDVSLRSPEVVSQSLDAAWEAFEKRKYLEASTTVEAIRKGPWVIGDREMAQMRQLVDTLNELHQEQYKRVGFFDEIAEQMKNVITETTSVENRTAIITHTSNLGQYNANEIFKGTLSYAYLLSDEPKIIDQLARKFGLLKDQDLKAQMEERFPGVQVRVRNIDNKDVPMREITFSFPEVGPQMSTGEASGVAVREDGSQDPPDYAGQPQERLRLAAEKSDRAMAQVRQQATNPGGIDMNAANLNMLIKRDGKGVPLPIAQQDMAQLIRVPGFVPQIIEITPVTALPILSQLQEQLQSQNSLASAS